MAPRANEILFLAVLVALGVGCALGLYLVIAQIPLHILIDPNEGWNAYHAQAVATHGALYPGPPSLMVNNYPPLSFLLIGCGGMDFIVLGRLISLAAFLILALLTALVAFETGSSARSAGFAALLLASLLLLGSDYVGMNDPQLLGHAIDLAGLHLFLTRKRTLVTIALTALVFVVAGFVKHNLFVLPLALATWLFFHDRRSAVRFVAIGVGLAVLGLILFRLAYGVSLLAVLETPRTYTVSAAAGAIGSWLALASVPLAGLVLLGVLEGGNPYVRLMALWAGIGVVVGAAFSGGAGVDVNAMFDAEIALGIASGLLLTRLRTRPLALDGLAALVYAAPFALTLYLAATPDWLTRDFWLRPGADDAETAQNNIAFLRAHKGPALCEELSLCYWAGKKAEVDVFNIGEAFKTGALSDDLLVSLLKDKYYAAIQFDSLEPFALTKRVHDVLLANYRVAHTDDNGVFLVPRP